MQLIWYVIWLSASSVICTCDDKMGQHVIIELFVSNNTRPMFLTNKPFVYEAFMEQLPAGVYPKPRGVMQ